MEHMHHGGFMQGGMHHAVAKGVKLECKSGCGGAYGHTPRGADEFAGAHFAHEKCRSRRICCGTFRSMAGCSRIIPKLVDASAMRCRERCCIMWRSGTRIVRIFSLPNKEEHIFGAGSEMTDWAEIAWLRLSRGERQQDSRRDDDV